MKKYKADKVFEHMKKKYADREDKDNMFGVGMTDTEFTNAIIYELLGEDWYVVDPLGHEQISEIAFHTIMRKYKAKRYKKYWENNIYLRIYFNAQPHTKEVYIDVICKKYIIHKDGACKIIGGEKNGRTFTDVCRVEKIRW